MKAVFRYVDHDRLSFPFVFLKTKLGAGRETWDWASVLLYFPCTAHTERYPLRSLMIKDNDNDIQTCISPVFFCWTALLQPD
jgi:hypothetical protein